MKQKTQKTSESSIWKKCLSPDGNAEGQRISIQGMRMKILGDREKAWGRVNGRIDGAFLKYENVQWQTRPERERQVNRMPCWSLDSTWEATRLDSQFGY